MIDGSFCRFVNKHERWKSFSWGRGIYSIERLKWNLIFMNLCWYFVVDRKWPTVEVTIYIEILWEACSSALEPLYRLYPYLAEIFPTRCGTAVTRLRIFWWSLFEDCFLNNILRVLNAYMYLLMRRSWLIFYGSKHGGVKIYFVIYLEKIKKQSHTETNFG